MRPVYFAVRPNTLALVRTVCVCVSLQFLHSFISACPGCPASPRLPRLTPPAPPHPLPCANALSPNANQEKYKIKSFRYTSLAHLSSNAHRGCCVLYTLSAYGASSGSGNWLLERARARFILCTRGDYDPRQMCVCVQLSGHSPSAARTAPLCVRSERILIE